MTNDLEARAVQAAREAVAEAVHKHPWSENIAAIITGRQDDDLRVIYAILGARAALAEIERDYVLERRT